MELSVIGQISGLSNYLYIPYEIIVVDNYAYVAVTGSDSLTVIDISTTTNPTLHGYYQHTTYLNAVTALDISGNYAYVGGQEYFTIIDISDPANPSRTGTHAVSKAASAVAVSGNYAYIPRNSVGVDVIDVSTPSTPSAAANFNWGPWWAGIVPTAFKVSGNYLYICDIGNNTFTSADISDPLNVTKADDVTIEHGGRQIDIYGNYAYVTDDSADELNVVDISDPTNMSITGIISGSGSPNYLGGAKSASYYNNSAYVSGHDDNSLVAIDVSNKSAPALLDEVHGSGSPNYINYPNSVDVSDTYQVICMVTQLNNNLLVVGGLNTTNYSADCILYAEENKAYSADILLYEIHDKSFEADMGTVYDRHYDADVSLYQTDIPKAFSADIAIEGNSIQDIVLYPREARYISSDGTNEVWGNSKTLLSTNEILYVNHQKTYAPVNSMARTGELKVYLSDLSGTADSVTLNIYAATAKIDSTSVWDDVASGGTYRGSLMGTTTLTSSSKNDYVVIDIETSGNYLSDYLYGSSSAYGVILEMVVPSGYTANIKIVGLYCWDEMDGEKQNPVIEYSYSYTPSAYPDTINITTAVSEDAYISEKYNTSIYNSNVVKCEKGETGGDTKHALFKFDLNNLPMGSDILQALIYIPRNVDDGEREHREILRRIYQDWDDSGVSWEKADSNFAWYEAGGHYDKNSTYDSYNFIVEPDLYTYDVTKLMQVAFESFSLTTAYDFYGFLIKDQDLIFDSREIDDTGLLEIKYLATSMNQPPEAPTLDSPTSGTYVVAQPTFIATINDDNAYGSSESDDLHFRIELSQDSEFSSITSFTTSASTTGWHWSALGDWSDDSQTFPIPAGGYTAGTSKVKFVMSETTSSIVEGVWYWRLIMIDDV